MSSAELVVDLFFGIAYSFYCVEMIVIFISHEMYGWLMIPFLRNVIGIDPAFYDYIFTVDADTVRFLLYNIFTRFADCFVGV
jgi:hypothetical protein